MRTIFLTSLLLLCALPVQAELLCVKRRVKVVNGAVNLANNLKVVNAAACPARHTLVKDLAAVKDQQISAFARITGDGTVLSFGGADITGVTVSQPREGDFEVTFTGSFKVPTAEDSEQNRRLFTVNSSAVADNYGSTNNAVSFASATQLMVTVFLWESSSNTDGFQSGINLSVLQGAAPTT